MPPSSSPETDLTGRQLGDFHLLRRLGRGAMAEVYLAEQKRLKRLVALKVLKPELAGDSTYLHRFQLEAQAAASLVHANIVQIYEVGCIDQLHFIAQEYVQGQNLLDYITRHGPPDLPHALSIMRQVAAALAKAAEQGVIHRDIKPENIMLTANGEVKVADFGLARLTSEISEINITRVGITLGTPLYMSPEQIEGKPLDPRSDLYSFGVTCYHMLAGIPPFTGETALGVAVQHLKKQPQPLESLRPDLPPALCRIVHQMLAKDPTRRFASARDMLRDLRRVQMEHFGDDWPEDLPAWDSIAAEMPTDPRIELTRQLEGLMKTGSSLRPGRFRRLWYAAGILAATALGAAIAWTTVVPQPLLAAKPAQSAIARQPTIWRQWLFASQLGTETAWQSVIDYFPEDDPAQRAKKEYFTLRANQQLALIYLHGLELDRAMKIFESLANLNLEDKRTETELRAFGLAGECGVLSLRGDSQESLESVLSKLLPIRNQLTSEEMQKLVAYAIKKNRSKSGQATTPEWDKWLKEQFRDDS